MPYSWSRVGNIQDELVIFPKSKVFSNIIYISILSDNNLSKRHKNQLKLTVAKLETI